MVARQSRTARPGFVGKAVLTLVLFLTPAAVAVEVTVVPTEGPQSVPVENPALFSFHLDPFVPTSGPLVFPCGTPFEMPPGSFYGWIEGPDRISDRNVFHGPRPDAGGPSHHELLFRVGPAGTVAVASKDIKSFPEDAEIRLLSSIAHLGDGNYGNEFARKLPAEQAANGVQMPVGSVVVAVADPGTGRYLAVSRPQNVKEGKRTVVALAPPEKSTFVVRLERAEPIASIGDDDVSVVLRTHGEERRRPDVQVPAMARVYCIWYDLDRGIATLEVGSEKYWMRDSDVRLESGEVTDFAGFLQPRAVLDIALVLPGDLDGQPTSITVRVNDEEIATSEVEPTFPAELKLEGLPRSMVGIGAVVGPWRFEGEADLSSGSGRVVLAPDVARVRGAVMVGDEPAQASVGFLTNRSTRNEEVVARFETDDYGEFTAVVFPSQVQPVALVSIGDRAPIWWWIDNMPLRDGDRLDIEIEGQALDIRIVDSSTGEGIADAAVTYGWEGSKGGGRQTVSDDEGRVLLPPVPADEVVLIVRAVGYRPTQRKIATHLQEPADEVVIPLQKEPEGDQITVLLHDGAPAAGAEAALIPTENAPPRWIRKADTQGNLTIGQYRPEELLAIRHPESSVFVRRIGELAHVHEIQLAPRGAPLKVRVIEPSGAPVPHAPVVLWLDGLRFQGGVLAWLTNGSDAADREGEWVAENLPPRPVELLAWQLSKDPEHAIALRNGDMDYRRQVVHPPWALPVTVEAVLR